MNIFFKGFIVNQVVVVDFKALSTCLFQSLLSIYKGLRTSFLRPTNNNIKTE